MTNPSQDPGGKPRSPKPNLTKRVTVLETARQEFDRRLSENTAAVQTVQSDVSGIEGRLAELGTDVATFRRALEAARQGGVPSFYEAMLEDGMERTDISRVLFLGTELNEGTQLDLDNAQVIVQVIGVLDTLQNKVADHSREIKSHGEQLHDHGERLSAIDNPWSGQLATLRRSVDVDVAHLEARDVWVVQTITEDTQVSSRPSWFAAAAAIVAFFVTWLVVWGVGHHLTGSVYGMNKASHKKIGTFGADLHYGWIGFFLGLVFAAAILGVHHIYRVWLQRRETQQAEDLDTDTPPAAPPAPPAAPPASPAAPNPPTAQYAAYTVSPPPSPAPPKGTPLSERMYGQPTYSDSSRQVPARA